MRGGRTDGRKDGRMDWNQCTLQLHCAGCINMKHATLGKRQSVSVHVSDWQRITRIMTSWHGNASSITDPLWWGIHRFCIWIYISPKVVLGIDGSNKGFVLAMWKAVLWTDDDAAHEVIYASTGLGDLNLHKELFSWHNQFSSIKKQKGPEIGRKGKKIGYHQCQFHMAIITTAQ